MGFFIESGCVVRKEDQEESFMVNGDVLVIVWDKLGRIVSKFQFLSCVGFVLQIQRGKELCALLTPKSLGSLNFSCCHAWLAVLACF